MQLDFDACVTQPTAGDFGVGVPCLLVLWFYATRAIVGKAVSFGTLVLVEFRLSLPWKRCHIVARLCNTPLAGYSQPSLMLLLTLLLLLYGPGFF